VCWLGRRGARVGGLAGRVGRQLRGVAVPSTIILHIGTNDVFSSSTYDIRGTIAENIWGIRRLLPNTRIIWSDILPRLFYYGEVRKGAGSRVARFYNTEARGVIYAMDNACSICHSGVLSPSNYGLFRPDGLHLSAEGLVVYIAILSEALMYFDSHPLSKVFPPTSH
jgi:hypothetical protein